MVVFCIKLDTLLHEGLMDMSTGPKLRKKVYILDESICINHSCKVRNRSIKQIGFHILLNFMKLHTIVLYE